MPHTIAPHLSVDARRSPSRLSRPVRMLLAMFAAVLIPVMAVTPPPAAANVYTTVGQVFQHGRSWQTWCEPYADRIQRCWAEIVSGGKWVFNNLTYVGGREAQWGSNPLANTGSWTSQGRQWRTECNTPATGRNGCRTYIWSDGQWVFNSMVLLNSGQSRNVTWRPSAATGGSATYGPAIPHNNPAPVPDTTVSYPAPAPKPRPAMPAATGKTWNIKMRANSVSNQSQVDNCNNTPSRWLGANHVVSHNHCQGWAADAWHGMKRGDRVVVRNASNAVVMQGLVDHDFTIGYYTPLPASREYPEAGSDIFWVQVSWREEIHRESNHIIVVRMR